MRQILALPAKDKKLNKTLFISFVDKDIVFKDIQKIRKEFNIDPVLLSYSLSPEDIKKLEDLQQSVEVKERAKKLLKKHKLSRSWIDVLHRFIVDNSLPSKDFNSTNLKVLLLDEGKENGIYIKIEDFTSKRDILKAWSWIVKNLKTKDKKIFFPTYYFRDKAIKNYFDQGKKVKDTYRSTQKVFGVSPDEGHLKKINNDMKKKK